jgi:imidazole glycerol-phosphate synthase subunit HisF
MLKKRIIGSIALKDNWVVQSIDFKKYLPIGKLKHSVDFLDRWGIDEILVLDINASKAKRSPNFKLINSETKNINVPITVGGGIKSVKDMVNIIKSGADKICINSYMLKNSNIIMEGAKTLGRQCIVASIDAIRIGQKYEVYDHINKIPTNLSPIDLSKKAVDNGAGEILIRSIHSDGMKNGYDIELISNISDKVKVPIIAAGGYGNPKHVMDCFSITDVSACAIGNSLNYSEHSVAIIKSYLSNNDCGIRHETAFTYENNSINHEGRISKYDDLYLENLIFEEIPEVKI